MIPTKAYEARATLYTKLFTAKEVYYTMIRAMKSDGLDVDDLTEDEKEKMETLYEMIEDVQALLDMYATVN